MYKISSMIAPYAIALCLIFPPPAPAHGAAPPLVVASIGPIHSLAAGVMAGVGAPVLLLRAGASPHNGALRPSDAAALRRADIVFWVGEDLETFLAKPLAALSSDARVVALARAPGVSLLAARHSGAWSDADAAAGHHAHGGVDMHIWLDPVNAEAMVAAIAAALSAVDPLNAETYRANAEALEGRIAALDRALRDRLGSVAATPYIVFHDAYHYLEARYGLSPAGAVTVSPDRAPGARTLNEIRKRIAATNAKCVFREPQFEPALIEVVASGTGARVAVLDPIGVDIEPGPDAYFALMRALAASLHACLAGS